MINIKKEEISTFRTKSPKKIAIIYPPYGSIDNEPGLKVVKDNYGIFPSLSLLYVAGCAKGAGHDVLFLDVNATLISKDEVLNQLKHYQPDYIFYTITTYQLKENLDWLIELKKSYPCSVVVGGVHMGIYPEETMRHKEIDVGFIGECDVMDYEAFSKVPGIIYRKEEKTYKTKSSPVLMNVDNAHLPATQLYALYLKEFQHDYWREFVKNPKSQIAIQRPGCTMPDEEIQAYCKQAYLEFYYRPNYVFKALLRVKSFSELMRSVKVAFQMRSSG
ncbi:MAG: hypothetical protein COB02_12510 [Candidatus Cloacimonadota bacterium]|nr:MAG: hypothetical protein COB02_12510 [Candidatus Cloacimonadota bacterium]